MKRVFFSFFICINFTAISFAQDNVAMHIISENIWEQDFLKAEKLTKSSDKPMLIYFTGSDWCGPCKMLVADIFETDKFKEGYKDEFIFYEADFPRNLDLVSVTQRKDNNKLKQKYGVKSYPTIVIVNSKGKEIGRKKSYSLMRDPSYHYSFFDEMLKKYR